MEFAKSQRLIVSMIMYFNVFGDAFVHDLACFQLCLVSFILKARSSKVIYVKRDVIVGNCIYFSCENPLQLQVCQDVPACF